MSQPNKKPSTLTAPAAKLASNVANKAAKSAYAAAESTRESAENVVKIGSNAVKEFMATGAEEAQKAQEKAFALGREGAEQLAKSADAVTKGLYEAISMSRDNIETCIECGNMTANFAKEVSGEVAESANQAFSDCVEASKAFFACRTLNDMFELQNKIFKSSMDNFFNQSAKLSSMTFEYATEALEPFNERVIQATDQLGKTLASA